MRTDNRPCVLVATAASRDPIAGALRLSRPQVEVLDVEPEELNAAIIRHCPRLVVYSEPSEVVETRVAAWVLLYPDGQNVGVVSVDGQSWTIPGMKLVHLLAVVDAAVGADVEVPPCRRG